MAVVSRCPVANRRRCPPLPILPLPLMPLLLQNLLLLASSQDSTGAVTSRLLLAARGSVADTLKVVSEDRDAQLTLGELR